MRPVAYDDFTSLGEVYDEAVLKTPEIDLFCSAGDWSIAASTALMPQRESWIFEHDTHWLCLMRGNDERGVRYLQALEAAWGLTCPLIGPNEMLLAESLSEVLLKKRRQWDVLLLSGIPVDSSLLNHCLAKLTRHFRLALGPVTHRHQAFIQKDIDIYLNKRSRNFRRSLKRSLKKATDLGVEFEKLHISSSDELTEAFIRVVHIEKRSWKGLSESGLTHDSMLTFYRELSHRLMERQALFLWIAKIGDEDVAYILGGEFGNTYRGLQFSYDHRFNYLGLGNLCQYVQMRELSGTSIKLYDLGTDMDYKKRWSERLQTTLTLVVYAG
jgi:CelD/BcsL family acetyltransferase involved in cellulose biosynthesis